MWGAETQQKFGASQVAIVGAHTSLAAEVAKNIALAGVGRLVLATCSGPGEAAAPAPGNFLARAGQAGDPGRGAAAACAKVLAEMNPMIQLEHCEAASCGELFESRRLEGCKLVIHVSPSTAELAEADALCRRSGRSFIGACVSGPSGFYFVDFGEHRFTDKVPSPEGLKVAQKTTQYVPLEEALRAPWTKMGRKANKLPCVVQVLHAVESGHGRVPGEEDYELCLKCRDTVAETAGVDPASVPDVLFRDILEREEMPAVAAIVGGELAQDALKWISKKGAPANNFFSFNVFDGQGQIDRLAL